MPARDETAFGALDVTATTTRTSQKSGGASGSATESRPSGRSPRRHSTKPPKIERAAEPEPRRASAESAGGSSTIPAARLAASASAAKAAAEDARPTPRGTVLRVVTSARSRRPSSTSLANLTHNRPQTDHYRPIGQAAIQENPRGPGKRSGHAGIHTPRRDAPYRESWRVCQCSASSLPASSA